MSKGPVKGKGKGKGAVKGKGGKGDKRMSKENKFGFGGKKSGSKKNNMKKDSGNDRSKGGPGGRGKQGGPGGRGKQGGKKMKGGGRKRWKVKCLKWLASNELNDVTIIFLSRVVYYIVFTPLAKFSFNVQVWYSFF